MAKEEEITKEVVEIFEKLAEILKIETFDNRVEDFKIGDIVKSTLLEGLFKVHKTCDKVVLIQPVTYKGHIYHVDPKFIKKIECNKKTLDVLYKS